MSGRNVIFAKQKIDGFASNASYGGLYTRDYNFPESGFEGTFKYSFTLEAGETYIVVWDGEEFPAIGQDAGAIMPGAVALGNCSAFDLDGNNEPFALATIAGSGVTFMSITETVDSHTVVIYQAGGDSLLPDTPVDFAYSSSFGVFAHSEFAPTFGIEAGQKYTIVWDNKKYARTAFTFTYADGSECVGLGNPVAAGQEGNNDPFCVVYDVTHSHLHYMSLEQDVSHTVAICQLAEGFDDGSVVLPEIQYDGFTYDSGSNFYALAIAADSEYPLFDLVANETYTVYWDGEPYVCVAGAVQTDDAEVVFVGNVSALGLQGGNEAAPFIIASAADGNELADLDDTKSSHSVSIYYGATTGNGDTTALPETALSGFEQDNTGFYGVYFSPAIYQLEAGTEYIVIWDGVEYKVTAIDIGDIMDGFVFAGNGADFIAPDSGEPFAITSYSDPEYSETVFYALRDYDKEHTVEIYRAESSETVFMPLDDYQFIESTNDDGYTAYCTFWDGTLESGRRYRVNWEGTEQIMPARTFDDGTIYIGNLGITGVGDDTGEEFLIANSGDEGICLIATSDTGSSHRMGVWITNDPLEDPEEPAPEDPEIPEDPEQAEGIILKDRNGDDVAYYGIETVTFDTTTEGKQQVYTKGEAVENVPVELNFASGDQIVVASEGTLVKSAVIKKPENFVAENIRYGEIVAGIEGKCIGDAEEVTVALSMPDGDQEVLPVTENKWMSKVIVQKPETLIPENIAKDVNIAGVWGNYIGGHDVVSASGSFTATGTGPQVVTMNLGVIPDVIFVMAYRYNAGYLTHCFGVSSDLAEKIDFEPQHSMLYNTNSLQMSSGFGIDAADSYGNGFIGEATPASFKIGGSLLKLYSGNTYYWYAMGGLLTHTDYFYIKTALDGAGNLIITDGVPEIQQIEIYVDGVLAKTVDYIHGPEFTVDISDIGDNFKTHTVSVKASGDGLDDLYPKRYYDSVTGWISAPAILGVTGLYAPETELTRTDDAVDLSYTINSNGTIYSDFNSIFPWSEAKLVTDSKGNKFVQMPEMWFRVGYDDQYRITDVAVSAAAHDEGEWYRVEPFCYGRYATNYNSTTTMVSKSGIKMTYGATRANLRSYASMNGSEYHINDLRNSTIMKFLWWIEWATKNAPSIMTGCYNGSGTTGGNAVITTGATDSLATPSGYELTRNRMRWHYIEDYIGGISEYLDGVYAMGLSGAIYASATNGVNSESTSNLNRLVYTNPADTYCIKAYGWDPNYPFLSMPCETTETADYTSYFCTRAYGYSDTTPIPMETTNYNYTNGGLGGTLNGFMIRLLPTTNAYINNGTRLMYRGTLA